MTSNAPLKRRRSRSSSTPQSSKVQSTKSSLLTNRTIPQVKSQASQKEEACSASVSRELGSQSNLRVGETHQDEQLCNTKGRPALYVEEQYGGIIGERDVVVKDVRVLEDDGNTGSRIAGVLPFPTRCPKRSQDAEISGKSSNVKANKSSTDLQNKDAVETSLTRATSRRSPCQTLSVASALDQKQWTGKGREDRMTESVIKDGYSEKPPVAVDTSSAKPSLWPHIKNSGGLACLGAFFTDILAARQTAGEITTPNTFKPPPRVTLTDAKREAWLRDLADANVPLKRLSRAIPHGLRGRMMLDQCLLKQVPIERAVWLAKCVGCNELRASRRKGLSADAMMEIENKWTLEWTLIFESFSLDCVNSSDQPDWKSRLNYAYVLGRTFSLL